jgi:co-chaperonin GroES (HSP10)
MPSTVFNKIRGDLRPIKDHILVVNMEQGERTTKGGVIVLDDNGKDRGIRPRWCQVWKVGKEQTDIRPGQWILVEHGRWTYGIHTEIAEGPEGEEFYVQRVDVSGVLGVQDEQPEL